MQNLDKMKRFAVAVIIPLMLGIAACTTLSDAELADKAFERQYFKEQYLDFRAACLKQDKRIYIIAKNRPPVLGIPHAGDKVNCY